MPGSAAEIGGASFGLVVGLQRFKDDLGRAESEASQASQRIGSSLTAGIDKATSAGLATTGARLQSFGASMSSAGMAMTLGITAPLAAVGGLSAKAAIDFESAFAGVRKTVDATEAQFATLETGIREMAKRLPQSASAIAGVAETAGQLGIAVPNILDFTEVMIGMGVATDLSSEQAATAMARLANITQMPQDQFDQLASTVVALGNAGASTESEIVNMGLRIAGAGHQVGLTEPQILGVAEALSSVGIEAEAGGTAISRVMTEIAKTVSEGGDKLAAFAMVAGQSASDFAAQFQTDPMSAINAFVGGLSRMSQSGQNVLGTLAELEFSDVRVQDTLLRLAGAGDILTNSVNNANTAWAQNTALQTEVAARNETFASQWQVFKNRVTDVAIELGQALIPSLLDLIDAAQPVLDMVVGLVKWFTDLPQPVQTTVLGILALTAALGPVLFIVGQLVSSFGAMVKVLGLASSAIQNVGLISTLTNPYVLAFIAALAGTYLIIKNWDTVKQWFENFRKFLSDLGSKLWEPLWTGLKAVINLIIRAWNALSFTLPQVSVFGRTFGGGTIGVPKLRELGQGGDLASSGLVVVGEHGREVLQLPKAARVTPLDRIGTQPAAMPESSRFVVEMDGRKVAEGLLPYYAERERITGRPAFGRA